MFFKRNLERETINVDGKLVTALVWGIYIVNRKC